MAFGPNRHSVFIVRLLRFHGHFITHRRSCRFGLWKGCFYTGTSFVGYDLGGVNIIFWPERGLLSSPTLALLALLAFDSLMKVDEMPTALGTAIAIHVPMSRRSPIQVLTEFVAALAQYLNECWCFCSFCGLCLRYPFKGSILMFLLPSWPCERVATLGRMKSKLFIGTHVVMWLFFFRCVLLFLWNSDVMFVSNISCRPCDLQTEKYLIMAGFFTTTTVRSMGLALHNMDNRKFQVLVIFSACGGMCTGRSMPVLTAYFPVLA